MQNPDLKHTGPPHPKVWVSCQDSVQHDTLHGNGCFFHDSNSTHPRCPRTFKRISSVGSKSLNSRGFWKMAKKKLRKAIRLPSHFVHHDLMPRKGQRLQQQQQKSSFIIHHTSIHSSILHHPFIPSISQVPAQGFRYFLGFRFKLWGWKCFSYLRESKSSSNVAPEASKKRQIDQLSNHGKPTQIWRLSKFPKGISKINITRTSNVGMTLQDAGKGRDVFFGGMNGGRNTSFVAEKSSRKSHPRRGGCRWKGTTFGGPILEWVIRSRHKNWKSSQPCRNVDSNKF